MIAVQYNLPMAKIIAIAERWGLAFLIMAAIYGFSSIPSTDMPVFGYLDLVVKKGGHALGYGLLALSYLRGLKGKSKDVDLQTLVIAWCMATLYSATDEFHQFFVLGRNPTAIDVLIDSLGAALSLVLAGKYYRQQRTTMQNNQ